MAKPQPPPPAKLHAQEMVAAIFAHYDTDKDGWLKHADVSRLEKETGDGGGIDPDSWAGLCEMLGADKNVVRLALRSADGSIACFLLVA